MPAPEPSSHTALPTTGYQTPAAGAGTSVTTASAYNIDINDPWALGTLGSSPINMGQPTGTSGSVLRPDDGGPKLNPYTNGANWTTASNVLTSFMSEYSTNPSNFNNLRADLANASYYGSTKLADIQSRAAGSDDAKAMGDALADWVRYTTGTGQTVSFADWLVGAGNNFNNNQAGNASTSTRAPLQLTSSATLGQYSEQAGQSELGRNTTAAEQAAYTAQYHGEEESAYNGGSQNAGAPDAEAKAFVDKNNNAEMQTHLQAGYARAILSALGPAVNTSGG